MFITIVRIPSLDELKQHFYPSSKLKYFEIHIARTDGKETAILVIKCRDCGRTVDSRKKEPIYLFQDVLLCKECYYKRKNKSAKKE